jgi:hypothetical protein
LEGYKNVSLKENTSISVSSGKKIKKIISNVCNAKKYAFNVAFGLGIKVSALNPMACCMFAKIAYYYAINVDGRDK